MADMVIAKPQKVGKTSKSSKTPISRRGGRKETQAWRGPESVENPWKTMVFASPARPARERTWAKKMADTVIANPRKTLENKQIQQNAHERAWAKKTGYIVTAHQQTVGNRWGTWFP